MSLTSCKVCFKASAEIFPTSTNMVGETNSSFSTWWRKWRNIVLTAGVTRSFQTFSTGICTCLDQWKHGHHWSARTSFWMRSAISAMCGIWWQLQWMSLLTCSTPWLPRGMLSRVWWLRMPQWWIKSTLWGQSWPASLFRLSAASLTTCSRGHWYYSSPLPCPTIQRHGLLLRPCVPSGRRTRVC